VLLPFPLIPTLIYFYLTHHNYDLLTSRYPILIGLTDCLSSESLIEAALLDIPVTTGLIDIASVGVSRKTDFQK
jgi:hypothetical protein